MKGNVELRKALDDLHDLTAEQHLAAIMNIKGHGITLHSKCVSGNCLSRALMPSESWHRCYEQITQEFFKSNSDIATDSAFANWLIDGEYLQAQNCGDLALYYNSGAWEHAGIMSGGKIVSKWGVGWFMYRHGELEVPLRYGIPQYFKMIGERRALELFIEFTIGIVGVDAFGLAFPRGVTAQVDGCPQRRET